jgi:site-specific DNA-methyltransferase (cytosine-N4-specific)
MGRFAIEERKDWLWWVTPKPLGKKPIHRWYVFPHSFTSELVDALINEWNLDEEDHILDPFTGAGTTVLAAKDKGISATGYDLSPLAVFASQVKIASYDPARLRNLWDHLRLRMIPARWNGAARDYPELVRKALPGKLLGAFDAVHQAIVSLKASPQERDFFKLALFATIPKFSRAVATGGWLKWVVRRKTITALPSAIAERVDLMLEDLPPASSSQKSLWRVEQADARALPDDTAAYTAVITSPPYPNRHDYTRVFGVELMFGFLDWEQTRQLRYQSFHSQPEAHPVRPKANNYTQPRHLAWAVARIRKKGEDPRVLDMIEGYFLDLYLTLREVRRVCKKGARVAFVVGNAQYRGVSIPVDELTAEVGEQAGLKCEKLIVARYRGNSAQQMAEYGRQPSRESVVVFRKV